MKLVIEVDLNAEMHPDAQSAFSAVFALLKSIMDSTSLPPDFDLRKSFEESGITKDWMVLCEGGHPHELDVAVSRAMLMKAPFSNTVYSRKQAEESGREMQTVFAKYEVGYNPTDGISVTDIAPPRTE